MTEESKLVQFNVQGNGNTTGSGNLTMKNSVVNGDLHFHFTQPEPVESKSKKRGWSPLVVKMVLVIAVIALLVFAPHAAAVLPYVVEVIKAVL